MENGNIETSQKKKYLEPTLHFTRKRLLVGEGDTAEKIIISELVKKDQPLLSFPDFANYSEKGYEKSPLRSGRNTHFSEDENTLLADTIGYPRIDIMEPEEGEEPTLLVSLIPLVKVSVDQMEATLILHPPVPNGFSTQSAPLPELLQEAGILFGIDQSALNQAQEIIQTGYNDFIDLPIAHGKVPEPGVDAYLRFELEIGPIAGRILDDNSIDFRERRIMIGVHAGELLATKIPAVAGTPGINVRGQEIEPEGGKDIKVKVANDAAFSEETGEARATKDGILTVVKDSVIKVCSRQEIPGDVDYTTGHINSLNCVTIRGSVQPGFKVSTGGDLEIGKEVMSATISSEANVVIKGGITGKKTTIKAFGDVDINFIEQGTIDSGGIVVIRKQTYYSNVSAAGDIRCRPGTTIIGGRLVAGGQLTVANVGSENCEPALLAAGVDVERLGLQEELRQDIRQQQDEIIQWLQRYGGNTRSKKIRKMEAKVDETKMKLLKLNLIPGTGLYSRVGTPTETSATDGDDQEIEARTLSIDKIHIDVSGTIYAGTELRVGNRILVLTNNVTNRRFKLNQNLKQIIAAPLKGKH
ncbi:MAG: FapA family protein [Proteobacteria bacterium]|nr:FapA family protein [Pseudomonadota bacterium]